jgi:hypothetical protein
MYSTQKMVAVGYIGIMFILQTVPEWLERLAVNAKVATVLPSIQHPPTV